MATNFIKVLDEQIAQLEGMLQDLAFQLRRLKEMRDRAAHQGAESVHFAGDERKSHFLRIAEVILAKGNAPMATSAIIRASGVSRNSLSQILHRTHKDSFVSYLQPGYTRKKLWRLTEEAAQEAARQLHGEQATLFGPEGDLSGSSAVQCCLRILRDRGNEPTSVLTLAHDALSRGYRARSQGTEDEVALTTATSFWAALGRDERFREVRPKVFALRTEDEGSPPQTPGRGGPPT